LAGSTVPQNIVASEGDAQVRVSWNSVSGASSYKIYRKATQGVTLSDELLGEVDAQKLFWKDTKLAMGLTSYYAVTSVTASGESAISSDDFGRVSSTEGLVWSYDGSLANSFNTVSIGNNGLRTFTSTGPFTIYDLLFSVDDSNPPTPIFNSVITSTGTHFHKVDSAKNTNVYAVIDSQYSGGTHQTTVRKYSTFAIPDWTYTFPGEFSSPSANSLDVQISDDGTKIIVYTKAFPNIRLTTFSASSGVILSEVAATPFLIGNPAAVNPFSISGDGSTATFITTNVIYFIDLMTGQQDYSTLQGTFTGGAAINFDGSRAAYGARGNQPGDMGKVYLFDRQSTIDYILRDTISLIESETQFTGLDLSDNGNRLVGAYYLGNKFGVKAWDTTTSTSTQLFNYEQTGSGNLINFALDIVLSDDPSLFALGLTGDGVGLVDQIQVFMIGQTGPLKTFATRGSIEELDFSPNGKRIIAAIRGQHYTESTLGIYGELNSYKIV